MCRYTSVLQVQLQNRFPLGDSRLVDWTCVHICCFCGILKQNLNEVIFLQIMSLAMLTNMEQQYLNQIYAFFHGSRPVGQISYICLLEKNFGKPQL